MSDVFEGPGWWMASDGKWYPPHLHADASYRARWVNVDVVAPSPDTSPAALASEPARAEPATTISPPAEKASGVAEPRSVRPVADVPPAAAPSFVPSDKVAERAAALADTARAESITEPAPDPVVSTPAPAAAPVAGVATTVEARVVPVHPEPSPAPETTAAPDPVENRVAREAAPMPQPVVAPHETPAPMQTNGADGFVAFGSPTSTPVSEILNRLGEHNGGPDGAPANGPASFAPPLDGLHAEGEPAGTSSVAEPTRADAAPAESNANTPVSTGDVAESMSEPANPAVVEAAVPPPTPEVRIGPPVEPDLDPIEFDPVAPSTPDPSVPPSRARLEVGAPNERGEERFGLLTPNRPTEQRIKLQEQPTLSASTDLVPVSLPEVAVYSDGPSLHDRLVAAVLFLSGVALIVGTFLVWTTSPGEELTGWDTSDGIVTIIAGVLGSAAAGPIFVGFRHVIPKTIAILSGLVALVVPGLKGLEVLSDSTLAETGVGVGFWIVVGGAIAMLLAGVADQSRFGD